MEGANIVDVRETTLTGLDLVTAGILSYNRVTDLRRTLTAVLSIENLAVLVLDNGSSDGSRELLEEAVTRYPTRLTVQLRNENIGIAARNEMFAHVTTPFLLSLDDDSWPRSAEDVHAMLRLMQSDDTIAAVCASCVHPDTGVAETAGIERFAGGGSADTGYDVVNIAAGGTMLRMAAVRETDGYGADFFWGREENDLAFQLLSKGWRVVYYPSALVWHAMSPVGRDVYGRLRMVTRNSLWLLWKYFPLTVSLPLALLFALRRLLPVVKDFRRLRPVLDGLREGFGGMGRMRAYAMVFDTAMTLRLRHWFLKLLYE
ncbi:MAG: glycosyltransferase [Bacteroidia bacterium]|nr:glycosyltransferase [Bacteroidia bacterium]